MIRKIFAAILLTVGIAFSATGAHASGATHTTVNVTPDGIAIGGWDTVAYFTENMAVAGSEEFSHEWSGATWLFSSAEHRDLFAADPEAYAPKFGGWCAYALSQGEYAAEVEPDTAWTVHDGALYLNWDRNIRDKWVRIGLDEAIPEGVENWATVSEEILEGEATYSRKSGSPWRN